MSEKKGKMKFKTIAGNEIDIDFNQVDSYRGVTIAGNTRGGTKIYFKDGSELLLYTPFDDVYNADPRP